MDGTGLVYHKSVTIIISNKILNDLSLDLSNHGRTESFVHRLISFWYSIFRHMYLRKYNVMIISHINKGKTDQGPKLTI